MSTALGATRLRGRSPRGKRLVADAPFGHWRTQTFIAGLRCGALTAPWVLDGPMDREVPRDNQDESGATIKMREPHPVSSRREGVARP